VINYVLLLLLLLLLCNAESRECTSECESYKSSIFMFRRVPQIARISRLAAAAVSMPWVVVVVVMVMVLLAK
jgi:hypothetical protein